MIRRLVAACLLLAGAVVGACSARPPSLLTASDPPELQADYAVFERRCSKCHALGRVYEGAFDNDAKWAAYVARMRRQPASGITETDSVAVLRYLHVLTIRQRAARGGGEAK